MEEKRNAFFMLRSYVEMIREMSPEDAKAYVLALADYALDGKETNLEGTAKVAFQGSLFPLKNSLERSIINSKNGKKGGAPKGNQNARKNNQKQPKTSENNQKQAEKEKERELEKDKELEKEKRVLERYITSKKENSENFENEFLENEEMRNVVFVVPQGSKFTPLERNEF